MEMRIITRPDFDGVVCAVLLKEAITTDPVLQWTQPNDIQNGSFSVQTRDVIANLPFDPRCALWFDHHISNAVTTPFEGLYRVAPSAAGLVYEYYKERLNSRFDELVRQTDKIDSAQLTMDEILYPEQHPYVILSMAASFEPRTHIPFCNRLVSLLRRLPIQDIVADQEVTQRCRRVIAANKTYLVHLKGHTTMQGGVAITDFRGLPTMPEGNRFLVYSLFPQSFVNIKLYYEGPKIGIKVGHSIINRSCRINVGRLMAAYGGGGHFGAGACRLEPPLAPTQLIEIINILSANQPNDN